MNEMTACSSQVTVDYVRVWGSKKNLFDDNLLHWLQTSTPSVRSAN